MVVDLASFAIIFIFNNCNYLLVVIQLEGEKIPNREIRMVCVDIFNKSMTSQNEVSKMELISVNYNFLKVNAHYNNRSRT